jgi:hypothetical protein
VVEASASFAMLLSSIAYWLTFAMCFLLFARSADWLAHGGQTRNLYFSYATYMILSPGIEAE